MKTRRYSVQRINMHAAELVDSETGQIGVTLWAGKEPFQSTGLGQTIPSVEVCKQIDVLNDNASGRLQAIENALQVFIRDPRISNWLRHNDPKSLEQAVRAIGWNVVGPTGVTVGEDSLKRKGQG